MAKKKIINQEQLEAAFNDDITLSALKEKWFKMAKVEKFPHTAAITKKLDELELLISARKEEILKNYGNS